MQVYQLFLVSFLISLIYPTSYGQTKEKDISLAISLSTQGHNISFDNTAFKVKFGKKIRIKYTNDAAKSSEIYHNVVLVRYGKINEALELLDNTPWDFDDDHDFNVLDEHPKIIMGHTKTLSPGQSDVIEFTPTKRGEYHFLCFMPGHASLGMRGVILVE